jgi:hypothetical protein
MTGGQQSYNEKKKNSLVEDPLKVGTHIIKESVQLYSPVSW